MAGRLRGKVVGTRTVAIASALAVVWSMLGGGVALAALSDSEWKAEAEAICTDADAALDSAASAAFAGLGPNDEPSAEQLVTFADQLVPIIEDAVQAVEDLDEPPSKKKNLKKWAKAARAVAAKAEADPTVLLDEGLFAKTSKLAKRLGLRGCA